MRKTSQNQFFIHISKLACSLCACFIILASTLSAAMVPPNAVLNMDSLGNMVAIWQNDDNGTNAIYASQCPVGGSWSVSQQISTGTYSEKPKLAINSSGQAVAIWRTRGAMPPFTLYAATIALQGSSTWSTPAAISTPGDCVTEYCSVAVNANSNAVISWQICSTDGIQMYSSTSILSEGTNSWNAPVLVGG